MQTNQPAKEIPLVSAKDFGANLKKILQTSKRESDEQLAAFQASNKAKRDAKKQR
jgi:hypothetical protein